MTLLEAAEEAHHLFVGPQRQVGVRQIDEEVVLDAVDERGERIAHRRDHREGAPLHEPPGLEHVHVRVVGSVAYERVVHRRVRFQVDVCEEEVARVVERPDEPRHVSP